MINEKICLKCNKIKPLNEFYKDKSRKLGVQPACKICSDVYRKKWRDNNRKQISISTKKYRQNNPEKRKETQANWNAKNLIKFSHYQHNRRAKIKNNGVCKILNKELKRLYNSPCFYCNSKLNIEIDHIIPISRGGKHSIGNLTSACRTCNSSKNNKFITEWKSLKRPQ